MKFEENLACLFELTAAIQDPQIKSSFVTLFNIIEELDSIRYYGWYSNKNRGLRKNTETVTAATPNIADQDWEKLEPESAYTKKCRMTWAALIKAVYEVDPLKCPKCGGTMKIISFIEDDATIQKILKHCGKWNEP